MTLDPKGLKAGACPCGRYPDPNAAWAEVNKARPRVQTLTDERDRLVELEREYQRTMDQQAHRISAQEDRIGNVLSQVQVLREALEKTRRILGGNGDRHRYRAISVIDAALAGLADRQGSRGRGRGRMSLDPEVIAKIGHDAYEAKAREMGHASGSPVPWSEVPEPYRSCTLAAYAAVSAYLGALDQAPEELKDLRGVEHRYVHRGDSVIISGAEYLQKSRLAGLREDMRPTLEDEANAAWAEVHKARSQAQALQSHWDEENRRVTELLVQVQVLREALEFYAEEAHWLDGACGEWIVEPGNHVSGDGFNHDEFEHDNGDRAQQALAGLPERQDPA